MGRNPIGFTEKLFTFTKENQLLGWWGTLSNTIKSIGPITIDSNRTTAYDKAAVALTLAEIAPVFDKSAEVVAVKTFTKLE